jgi:hypothetical protein
MNRETANKDQEQGEGQRMKEDRPRVRRAKTEKRNSRDRAKPERISRAGENE